jgi:hydroxyethylthiazole kinase-like uncharacterized protein yjeF
MEHAARGMADVIRSRFAEGASVCIISGVGNNGADGIVLARQLWGAYEVSLCLPFGVKSEMAKLQWERVQKLGIEAVKEPHDADVIVDALFGAGLNRELDAQTQQLIHRLNALRGFKLACDVPTGIGSDGRLMPCAFDADVTVTMGARKEVLYLDEAKPYVGEIVCADLGVSAGMYVQPTHAYVLEASDLKLPSRPIDGATHKGSFGHTAVFCGEKEGAGIIVATAASRFGAGLTTLVVHEKITPPPFLMHTTDIPQTASAIAIGMGLGNHFDETFLREYVVQNHLPVVLDADAFYSETLLEILAQKEREVVVTPHPKEFLCMWQRLTGEVLDVTYIQQHRFEAVRRFNARYPHVTLLLKGANMLIMQEETLYVNPLGSAKLSKGGSGDVLSGLIVSLLAQGYSGIDAAIQGSLALTLAARKYRGASYAMLPTDIIDEVAKL